MSKFHCSFREIFRSNDAGKCIVFKLYIEKGVKFIGDFTKVPVKYIGSPVTEFTWLRRLMQEEVRGRIGSLYL